MRGKKGFLLVEGHGEEAAMNNLIARISSNLNFYHVNWMPAMRVPNLHQWENPRGRGGVKAGAEMMRRRSDVGALMIIRDEDDLCPKALAPQIASRLKDLDLPFPVAYVLLHPEYEVLFLPCLGNMSSFGFKDDLTWDRDTWEARRGIKEWLSNHLPRGKSYKPTVDQLKMTQKIDLEQLRAANVPSFGSLERAVKMVLEHFGAPGVIYPNISSPPI